MRKIGIISVIMVLMLVITACGNSNDDTSGASEETSTTTKGTVTTITAKEAKARIDSGDSVVILDVRTEDEYAEKHIEDAILIPNEEIDTKRPELLPVLDAEILVYCRSGNRSAQASQKLADMGYTNVKDFGGINDWDYDTVSGDWEGKAGNFSSFRAGQLDGKMADEKIFEDSKLTMVNVWATYCGPCLREMPDLGEINKEYEKKGVQIVGIAIDTMIEGNNILQSNVETARGIVKDTGANYIHLVPSKDLINAGLAQVSAVPTTFFVNNKGEIVGKTYTGSRDKEAWVEIIEETLNEMEG